MPVRSTSIRAYYDELPKIGARQRQVLEALAYHGNLSNREIAKMTGLEIATVCGRCFELRQAGLVKEYGTKVDPATKKTVTIWGLVQFNKPEQVEMF